MKASSRDEDDGQERGGHAHPLPPRQALVEDEAGQQNRRCRVKGTENRGHVQPPQAGSQGKKGIAAGIKNAGQGDPT